MISLLILMIAVSYVLYERQKLRKITDNLNQMLNEAIDGTLTESSYDESLLSLLECKLYRFINSSYLSKQKIDEERQTIKSLISDISHQTKTPIANISLYCELLNEHPSMTDETKPLLNEMKNQTEKLNFLVQSLVNTSRLESGIIAVNPERCSINGLIERVMMTLHQKAQQKNVKLIYSNQTYCEAKFDSKWTEEALYNIVENAIKYTPDGGDVIISTVEYELFSLIDVRDTGIGISESEINEIFKRFYRSPSVAQVEGVGIGLYLAREIISKQGGYIKVSSKINQGTIFSIFLPR